MNAIIGYKLKLRPHFDVLNAIYGDRTTFTLPFMRDTIDNQEDVGVDILPDNVHVNLESNTVEVEDVDINATEETQNFTVEHDNIDLTENAPSQRRKC